MAQPQTSQDIIALKIDDPLMRTQLSQLCARLMPHVSICFVEHSDDERLVKTDDLLSTPPVKIGRFLERIHGHIQAQNEITWRRGDIINMGLYTLLPDENILKPRDKSADAIRLTEKERNILLVLFAAKGEIVERRTILDRVWGYGEDIETHTLETHIYRLRQKIEDEPAEPVFLITEEPGYHLAL